MINIKKVGLTALAGSLAAVTAQAGELSVSGGANVTYVTQSGGNIAQSLGHDKDVKFSGSGELDNGWTFAIHTLSKDDLTVSSTATGGSLIPKTVIVILAVVVAVPSESV